MFNHIPTKTPVFNSFDITEYRGYSIERIERKRGGKKVWHYRIVGQKGHFSALKYAYDEVDYLIERRHRQWQKRIS